MGMPGSGAVYISNPFSSDQPDHVRIMPSPLSADNARAPASLELLGGDILLELASCLSRLDLVNFVITVRSLPTANLRSVFHNPIRF